MARPTDVRIKDVQHAFEEFRYRTPIKFGGATVDRVTLLNVTMTVETVSGKVASGFGSMPLGNVWAWPTKTLTYYETLAGMKDAARRIGSIYEMPEHGKCHPVHLTHCLEPAFGLVAEGVAKQFAIESAVPELAVYVVASAFDAALHDAYGKAHALNCYHTYGRDFLDIDLGHMLGEEFAGEYLEGYIARTPQPTMPLYHLVGALDPLTTADVTNPVNDGLPETLGEWIARDGLTHLKIKLDGDDMGWDLARVLGVNRVASEMRAGNWSYSLDFNERCREVGYLVEFLHRLKSDAPAAFDRVQYVEQPTARDLRANSANRMHEAAAIKPVVIDESLLDLETLMLAREQGYTGVAFKACKGQTQTLLLAAAAQKFGMFRCVQDLTCPGASLIHSAGLAAHIPGVAAIEANARQYVPAANAAWENRFPGIFTMRNGAMATGQLTGPGLGAV